MSYKDLEIYRLSYELAVKVHKFTLKLPKYDELGRKINKYIQYVEKEWK